MTPRDMNDKEREVVNHALLEVCPYIPRDEVSREMLVGALDEEMRYVASMRGNQYGPMALEEMGALIDDILNENINWPSQ